MNGKYMTHLLCYINALLDKTSVCQLKYVFFVLSACNKIIDHLYGKGKEFSKI